MKNKNIKASFIVLSLFFFTVSCSHKNIVEGYIGYPSDYVPQMEVYLENVETGAQLKMMVETSFEGESAYCFQNVPDGKYIIFAIPTDPDIETLVGGYTNAVPCGLTVDCNDHGYIELDVKNGTHLKDINIYDWYTDDVVVKQKQYYI